nr:EFb protein - fowlpox virus (strain HP444) [Fowlpox virus]
MQGKRRHLKKTSQGQQKQRHQDLANGQMVLLQNLLVRTHGSLIQSQVAFRVGNITRLQNSLIINRGSTQQ